MVNGQKLIDFRGSSYIAKFPNVGQMMDIENMKMTLTNGKYSVMAVSGMKIHLWQLDMVDAISYFSVLCPEMGKDLGIKNWRDLDADLGKEITLAYVKQFVPWIKPLLDELFKMEDTDGDKSKAVE